MRAATHRGRRDADVVKDVLLTSADALFRENHPVAAGVEPK
jgi:hypothetical protein